MEAAINCADTISEKSSYMEHIGQSDAQIDFLEEEHDDCY